MGRPFERWPAYLFSGDQRDELLCGFIVLLDAAGEDVVVPAVDFECVVSEGFGDAGLGAEVDELGDDVAADDGG